MKKTTEHKSTIELTILGILTRSPMSAYEITGFIEAKKVNRMLKISFPAVFKVCKKLYQNGILDGKSVQEGENPEKIIYSINDKGRQKFISLMEHYSSNLDPFYFDFNAFIWNLESLEQEQAMTMLNNLRNNILNLQKGVHIHEKEVTYAPFAVRMIVRQYCLTADALAEWINYTIEEFQKKR